MKTFESVQKQLTIARSEIESLRDRCRRLQMSINKSISESKELAKRPVVSQVKEVETLKEEGERFVEEHLEE